MVEIDHVLADMNNLHERLLGKQFFLACYLGDGVDREKLRREIKELEEQIKHSEEAVECAMPKRR